MKVTVIPVITGEHGTVPKGLVKGLADLEIGGQGETIQTTTLITSVRIPIRVLEIWGDLLWKTQTSNNNNWMQQTSIKGVLD